MTNEKTPTPQYLAYMIRLRRDSGSTPWRVTVENPHTGERWGFAGLRRFVEFLEAQTGEIFESTPSKNKENGNAS